MKCGFVPRLVLAIVVGTAALTSGSARADVSAADVEKFLIEGRLADGAAAMEAALQTSPGDRVAGFGLGMIQFARAIEGLGQSQYKFGLLQNRRQALPFMRLPVPENEAAEPISYEDFRGIIQEAVHGFLKAEATLAAVPAGEVKIPVTIGQVRFDLNGDGIATDEESLWGIMEGMQQGLRRVDDGPQVTQLKVAFDEGDVLWFRGYCHVMAGIGEAMLAYDGSNQFERTAHLFYPKVETPYGFLGEEGTGPFMGFNTQNILDVVALIHTTNYEVLEADRMQTALKHFEQVIALSRESWKRINLETDNDHEWLPNPKQTSVIGAMSVPLEMQQQWMAFLNEAGLILQGRKLLPFWRGSQSSGFAFDGSFTPNPEVGINLRKVFTEPTDFDLVLWLQGSGFEPYLEAGPQTDPNFWRETSDVFRGQFLMFAFWFN